MRLWLKMPPDFARKQEKITTCSCRETSISMKMCKIPVLKFSMSGFMLKGDILTQNCPVQLYQLYPGLFSQQTFEGPNTFCNFIYRRVYVSQSSKRSSQSSSLWQRDIWPCAPSIFQLQPSTELYNALQRATVPNALYYQWGAKVNFVHVQ